MNRALSAVAALGAALLLATPASSHENGPVLIIRHQRGCHGWCLVNRPMSQTIWLKRGAHLEIGNNDVMPHKLMQVGGPPVTLPEGPTMNSLGAMVEISFPKAGV
jgi:hypothetical protein